MQEITESFLGIIAGDIEKLLIEHMESICFAYKKTGGMKIAMSITFDPSNNGIVVNYGMNYDLEPKPEPPEKIKVKFKRTINEEQADLEFLGKEVKEGRMTFTRGDEQHD